MGATEARATFAGGCFWCLEHAFERAPGVLAVVPGYTGGSTPDPTYEAVGTGTTGHYEAVEVAYDPALTDYERLLEIFWRQIDPTDGGGQFVDRGPQYRPAVFVRDEAQRAAAEASRDRVARSGRFRRPIAVAILPAGPFHAAEAYHRGYARRNPERYRHYRWGSGRDEFLERAWGTEAPGGGDAPASKPAWHGFRKPPAEELRRRLTPLQHAVTQEEGTEPPFANEFWDDHREGIYVDVVSGEPLFSSRDKFDSGTGWPSFTRPLEPGNVLEREDQRILPPRTEIRSRHAGSHLGHVFPDGPGPTGRRYCVNSAALRFVPRGAMEREGYGDYLLLFER
jgi:peptide methionine sulfoxide reductase msrA/msrB